MLPFQQLCIIFLRLPNTPFLVSTVSPSEEAKPRRASFCAEVRFFRDRDSHSHELVASAAGAQERNALALEAEGRAGLRALGYVELYLTVERGDLDLRAERRSRKGYVLIKEHRRALALKPCVGLHEHRYQQIAGRAAVYAGVALSAQRYGLSVIDAGRDADAHLVLAADAADAVAGAARAMDDLAATLALIAARVLLHHTERRALRGFHLTRALAVGADLSSRAAAQPVPLQSGHCSTRVTNTSFFDAERRFLKLYVHVCAQIFSPLRGAFRVLTAATAAEAENVAEYIAKAAEITETSEIAKAAETALAAVALARVERGVAETIVLCALISIRKDFVSLVYLFKPRFALFVAGMKIGVIFFGKLSVCFLS